MAANEAAAMGGCHGPVVFLRLVLGEYVLFCFVVPDVLFFRSFVFRCGSRTEGE